MAKPINPNAPQVNNLVSPAQAGRTGSAGSAAAAGLSDVATNAKGKSPGSSSVAISEGGRGRAEAMAKALDIAKNTPDIREDRVADIKARIANGSYQVDSGAIADGMLREAIKDHLATDR